MIDIVMNVLLFVDVIAALLLIGIILIQQSKSGGGLGALGGGMTESVFGTAAGNIITKTTVVLAAVFLGVTLVLAVLSGQRAEQQGIADRLEQQESAPLELEDMPETEEQAQDDAEATPGENVSSGTDEGAADAPDDQ